MYNLKILGSVSPYCKNDMNCPGYLVYNDNNKILLDCGFGISSLLKFPDDLNNLTIIISHYHKDHYADLFAIKYAILCYENLGLLKSYVNVYVPKIDKNEENFLDYNLIKAEESDKFIVHEYDSNSKINIGGINISFMETYHSIRNYSIKMMYNNNSLVYSGDMGYKNIDNYIEFIKNARIFICECTFLQNEYINNNYHMHTNEVLELARLSNCDKVILTHTWPENDKLEYLNEVNKMFKNTSIAKENEILYNIFGNII